MIHFEIYFRSPVLLEIPHFASNAGGEREIVILRSNDGETWSQHISDAMGDGEIYQVGGHFRIFL